MRSLLSKEDACFRNACLRQFWEKFFDDRHFLGIWTLVCWLVRLYHPIVQSHMTFWCSWKNLPNAFPSPIIRINPFHTSKTTSSTKTILWINVFLLLLFLFSVSITNFWCDTSKWLNFIILQNILFCVQQKKETVSEQLEGEKVMTDFYFFLI